VIEVTALALEKLNEVRGMAPDRPVLRVYVAGRSCCGYQYGLALDDAPGADDTVVERAGITIAVDPMSLPFVEGATIDHVEGSEGAGFTVRNDRLASEGGGCACGRR
jgi:iron-sulfur cluster assembly accessory protein